MLVAIDNDKRLFCVFVGLQILFLVLSSEKTMVLIAPLLMLASIFVFAALSNRLDDEKRLFRSSKGRKGFIFYYFLYLLLATMAWGIGLVLLYLFPLMLQSK